MDTIEYLTKSAIAITRNAAEERIAINQLGKSLGMGFATCDECHDVTPHLDETCLTCRGPHVSIGHKVRLKMLYGKPRKS